MKSKIQHKIVESHKQEHQGRMIAFLLTAEQMTSQDRSIMKSTNSIKRPRTPLKFVDECLGTNIFSKII